MDGSFLIHINTFLLYKCVFYAELFIIMHNLNLIMHIML